MNTYTTVRQAGFSSISIGCHATRESCVVLVSREDYDLARGVGDKCRTTILISGVSLDVAKLRLRQLQFIDRGYADEDDDACDEFIDRGYADEDDDACDDPRYEPRPVDTLTSEEVEALDFYKQVVSEFERLRVDITHATNKLKHDADQRAAEHKRAQQEAKDRKAGRTGDKAKDKEDRERALLAILLAKYPEPR